MKRTLSVLLAALLVIAVGGQAKASFDDAGLVRVVYRTDGTAEVGTSLGQVRDLVAGNNLMVGAGATLGIDLADFGAGASYENLRVAYFAFDSQSGETWLSGKFGAPVPVSGALGAFDTIQTVTNSIQSYYRQLPGGSATDPVQVNALKSNPDAYWNRANSGGFTNGIFSGFINGGGNAEETLANLLNPNGLIDLGFYHWDYEAYNTAGTLVATIQTSLGTDGLGKTTINPSAVNPVPVPAAVWLLGTGIVGLVGIRRRKN